MLLSGAVAPPFTVSHQVAGDRSYVRFHRTVRVPGASLVPEEYLFVIGTPVAGQVMIDIYRDGGTRLVASVLGIESRRRDSSPVSIVEYPRTNPSVLRAWFRPGNAVGFEFVYGAAEAKLLYLATGEAVPFTASMRVRREDVGVIPVALSSSSTVTETVGTTGRLPKPVRALGPGEHLEAARSGVAARLSSLPIDAQRQLLIVIELIERVERAHYNGQADRRREGLRVTINTVKGLLAAAATRFGGIVRLDRDTEAALERAQAPLDCVRLIDSRLARQPWQRAVPARLNRSPISKETTYVPCTTPLTSSWRSRLPISSMAFSETSAASTLRVQRTRWPFSGHGWPAVASTFPRSSAPAR